METMKASERLGTEPIGKLILKLSIPAVIAQIVNVLYNIIDRVYLGHIEGVGTLALTGIGVTFPIIVGISAFSAFAGYAGAPLSSIELGRKNYKKAEKILGNSVTITLFFTLIIPTIVYIFREQLLFSFGASENILPYALDYLNIYLIGTIFVLIALGLNPFISSQGFPKEAMFSILIGAITNLILDPIFIFKFHMGIRGAAWATVISQGLSACWIFFFLTSNKSVIKIKLKTLIPDFKIIKNILVLGTSSFTMQITESMLGVTLNKSLQIHGGDLYVGAMAIAQSIMQLISIPIRGFTYGSQPIVSYNFGAKNKERVMKSTKIIVGYATLILGFSSLMTIIFPEFFSSMFTKDPELLELMGKTLPIYMGGMVIFGIQNGGQAVFLGIGLAKTSIFLALFRKILLLIPLALILPNYIGVMGVFYAEFISDTLSAITTLFIFMFIFKKVVDKNMQ
ncbi:MAG: MATE family efflux transporter [Fusobacterium perfoetens]|uniref:MATE family efflux transporter n=1 Tax=Fusobacterium perfoetens TaxID=852 RepID=UPI0023F01DAD|nr:MATE family efflux transporter [Fusobacterium perfoetens]MCI6152719.1 MATE family efflux transporter [Fusobacterium perfoetens]MDY3236613.1 MATE family efflux transporter [Fusobacterium perfoetens]